MGDKTKKVKKGVKKAGKKVENSRKKDEKEIREEEKELDWKNGIDEMISISQL